MTHLSLWDIARLVDGQLTGDGSIRITGAAILRDATCGDITLVDRPELLRRLGGCKASAVVIGRDIPVDDIPSVAVDDVHRAFAQIVAHFQPSRRQKQTGVSPAAHVAETARLAEDVTVYPGAAIGEDVQIGAGSTVHAGACIMAGSVLAENVTVFPNAVLYENTMVGPRVLIHAGAVLGAYGFGYETVDGQHQLSAQLGNVVVEADVEIGACTTIDRGTYGPTVIGRGTKIDNQVMIAHNCRIGRHNVLCSQVGIAGSTTTGDYVVMAGQVGVRDHVAIGDRAVLGAKAGVVNDVPENVTYIGIPATPERKQKLLQAALSKLPEMRRQVRAMQRTVDRIAGEDEAAAQDAA